MDEALAELKEVIKPESEADAATISAKVDTLNEASQKMGAAMYAAAAEQGESGDVPGGEPGAGEGHTGSDDSDDDIVDAEVVDDEPKDSK